MYCVSRCFHFSFMILRLITNAFVFIAADVIKAINESKDLQAFTLEGNTLGVEAAKAIAEALSKRPEFEVDDLIICLISFQHKYIVV